MKPAALADFVGTFLQALEGHGGRGPSLREDCSTESDRSWAASTHELAANVGRPAEPAYPRSRRHPEPPEEPSTRERLIDAAIELFAERGYTAVTVRDLARATGLTTGSIYGNFANKAILLVEAIESRLAHDLEHLPDTLIETGSPAELIEFHLEGFAQRTQLRALLIEGAAAARSDPEVHDRLREVELRHQESWVAGFERWLHAYDSSPTVDTQTAVSSMWCAELGLGLLEAFDLPDASPRGHGGVVRNDLFDLRPGQPQGVDGSQGGRQPSDESVDRHRVPWRTPDRAQRRRGGWMNDPLYGRAKGFPSRSRTARLQLCDQIQTDISSTRPLG